MKKHLTAFILFYSISFAYSQMSNGMHPAVNINIPSDFHQLSVEEINKKYTLPTNRPTVVYASSDKTANITYNYTQNPLPKERIKELKELLVQQFGAAKMQILSSDIKEINTKEFVFIEMVAPSYTGGNVYNIITATNLEDRMLLISFNCPEFLMEKWKPTAFEILESIKIME